MRGIVLVGHGSLRRGAGAAMIRLAARVREARIAPVVAAGFLNYSRPSFAEAVERCLKQGARQIIVQPYFLVPGVFVQEDLPRLVRAAELAYPEVDFQLAAALGAHPALARVVLQRADQALEAAGLTDGAATTGLLLMAHGSPEPATVGVIAEVAAWVGVRRPGLEVQAGFLDLNAPTISAAIDQLAECGVRQLVAVPYFLQLGRHVAADLPALLAAGQARQPQLRIVRAGHIGYAPPLVEVIAERVAEAARVAVPVLRVSEPFISARPEHTILTMGKYASML